MWAQRMRENVKVKKWRKRESEKETLGGRVQCDSDEVVNQEEVGEQVKSYNNKEETKGTKRLG